MAALLTLFRHAARAASPATDVELLDRFISGRDEDAFAELVRRHGPVVYRVCLRLVGPTAADDAFQAAFLVLATRLPAARAASSIGGWLVGVAGRVARQMRRAAGRRARYESAAIATREDEPSEHAIDLADQFRVLDEELARLPDRLRDPVVLCLLQGRTQEEAAVELGRDARTLRRRLERAKQVLRARLERRGVLPAVAAALVAGAGSVNAAVPHNLSSRTVAMVFDFLTGGRALAQTAPVVLANGVATTMMARKVMHVMAALAAGLVGLGVVAASDDPPTPAVVPPVLKGADPRTVTSIVQAAPGKKPVERQIVIEAMCMEVPSEFRTECGLEEVSVLSDRETKMFKRLVRSVVGEGKLDILSRPQLRLMENQKGFCQIGQEFPYPINEEKDGKISQTKGVAYRSVGAILQVTPKLSVDGKLIQLAIELQTSSVSPTTVSLGNGLTAPAFNIQSVQSTVVLPEGGTVVMLGGTRKPKDEPVLETLWVLKASIVRGAGEIVPPKAKPAELTAPPRLPAGVPPAPLGIVTPRPIVFPTAAPLLGVVPVMPTPTPPRPAPDGTADSTLEGRIPALTTRPFRTT